MTLSSAMRVSSTGMSAERFRMDVISANIANANSTGPNAYQARSVELAGDTQGVRVLRTSVSQAPPRRVFEPGNPLAGPDGMVAYSNVNPVTEMVNMIGASRAYEANVAAFNSARAMLQSALTIGSRA